MILEDLGTQQTTCPHMDWEKVEAIDETYWRCVDCGATADIDADLTAKHYRNNGIS